MCDTDIKQRNTDVDGSIAGYFFQVLLAIEALTGLTNDGDSVGIECGADIRIITEKERYVSIEAKFHKSNMNRFSSDIVKTIYNFYFTNSQDDELYFVTNVDLSTAKDRAFFNLDWNNINYKDAKVEYIKESILRYCVKSKSKTEKEFSTKFDDYKKRMGLETEAAIQSLKGDIEKRNEKYEDYAYVDRNVNYEDFIEKVRFVFKDELKKESVKALEENITANLKNNYSDCIKNLDLSDESIFERIINLLVYRFFMTTGHNSEVNTVNLELEKKMKLSVRDLKDILSTYKDEQDNFYENEMIIQIKMAFKDEEDNYLRIINSKGEPFQEKLIEIYFKIRNEFFIITDSTKYKDIINNYCLGVKSYNLFIGYKKIVNLLFFLTALTFVKEHKESKGTGLEVSCTIEEESMNNIVYSDLEKYCYKSMLNTSNNDFEEFFSTFIKETYNSTKLVKTRTIIAGEIFLQGYAPCNYRGKSEALNKRINFAIKQSKISKNEQLCTYYENLDYRCIQCVWLIADIATLLKNSDKFIFNGCKGEL